MWNVNTDIFDYFFIKLFAAAVVDCAVCVLDCELHTHHHFWLIFKVAAIWVSAPLRFAWVDSICSCVFLHMLNTNMGACFIFQILYTGDYSRQEDRHLMAAEMPNVRPDIVIIVRTWDLDFYTLCNTVTELGSGIFRDDYLALICDFPWMSCEKDVTLVYFMYCACQFPVNQVSVVVSLVVCVMFFR